MKKIEKVAKQLDDEVTDMWSEGKISGDEALAARHFIEKFKTLLTATTK
jgi:hypothetical protein